MLQAISNHKYNLGLVGNCSYLAMPSTTGNIEWLCWPRFDSSFVFGGLLDSGPKGGHFYVSPASENYKVRQYYLENTAILCTEFKTSEGSFRVVDCAPRFKQHGRNHHPLVLIRKIELLSGAPRIKFDCEPRYDYGRLKSKAYQSSSHFRFDGFPEVLRLYTTLPLTYWREKMTYTLTDDEYCILTWGVKINSNIKTYSERVLEETRNYWLNWSAQCHVGSFRQREILRSAITLKLHQYEDTGAIIAAPTTSLPEYPGAGRNWDYRYSWIRDAFYTLGALNEVGKFDELHRYSRYIQSLLTQETERMQPLYMISGAAEIEEKVLDLQGYMGNQPVRVGNQAYTHIQNDLYGQILLSLLPLYVDARFPREKVPVQEMMLVHQILGIIDRLIEEPDAGLWEFRNLKQNHCYTYLFHWAGALAAKKIGRFYNDATLVKMADKIQKRSREWIERCYDPEQKCYTQAESSPHMDASLFQLVTMGYINPISRRARDHVKALEENLSAAPGLFYRYKHKDDFGDTKASFLVCAFWYIEALAMTGRIDQAIQYFDQLQECSNHLGLFSEDFDHKNRSQWGNFPQTYSHVGLIHAATRINTRLDQPDFL